jgi:hypothetical protein
MTAEKVSAALKAYSAALDAADAQMTATIAQAQRTIAEAQRWRDAAALLAMATCQKVLDAECEPGIRMTVSVSPCAAHEPEDAPAGVVGCCAQVAS